MVVAIGGLSDDPRFGVALETLLGPDFLVVAAGEERGALPRVWWDDSSCQSVATISTLNAAENSIKAIIVGERLFDWAPRCVLPAPPQYPEHYPVAEWNATLFAVLSSCSCLVINRPVCRWWPPTRQVFGFGGYEVGAPLTVPRRRIATGRDDALAFARSCEYRVVVSGEADGEESCSPQRDDVASCIERALERHSVVYLTQRYGGRPWLTVVATKHVVSGCAEESWFVDDDIGRRNEPLYTRARLPRSVNAALLALMDRLHMDLAEIRMLERDDGSWLCYSLSAWPRLARMPFAAAEVAEHLVAHIRTNSRWS